MPIEMLAGIVLAAGRDIGMRRDVAQRITLAQLAQQKFEPPVLRRREVVFAIAFELDADRKIVAALTPEKLRRTGVPGALVATDELDQLAASAHQKVRRHLQRGEVTIGWMSRGIETIAEQLLDRVAAESPRRQADVVDHDQVDRDAGRAGIVVG